MNKLNFITRQGQVKDLSEMQKLYADTIATICAADYDEKQVEAWASGINNKQRWNDVITKQFVVIAQSADQIIGFATLANGNYIDFLYVHKDHQRQGIAQRLLDDIIAEARRLKQMALTSDVSKTAKLFFEKNNFTVLTKQIVNRKGINLTNYKMMKMLG